ncbi:MAG: proline--tRNA ligase [Simkania negevensis]|nr:proline--tRNA ligase [Simkania negevensis]
MNEKEKRAISPTRKEDYPSWYQEVIKAADLAEHAPVRGCMVIKPWGYAIWENIQRILDRKIKETGHQNAYFPLFIPLSFFEREAKHIEGFAKECAVVTHHRLVKGKEGKLIPASPLEEPLVVRPTSEMIIGEMFSQWITSYRDLPLLINQWANVVRWEMRPRMFLRTAEFLWQEGHTAHATREEALEEALKMLHVYVDFVQNVLAIPVIKGEKSERERFPGAENTFTFEAMMQDGKALQGGTSHFLGQTFSKAAHISFTTKEEKKEFAWTTSWGVTTRLIGGLIMTHGDDDGLVLPPRIASAQLVIIPLIHKESDQREIFSYCLKLKEKLEKVSYHGGPLKVLFDQREGRAGEKIWSWIKKGVPMRIEVGKRELDQGYLSMVRRDRGHKEFEKISEEKLLQEITERLDLMQKSLFEKANHFLRSHLITIDSKEAFYQFFQKEEVGFALCHWDGDLKMEEMLQKDLGVTIRCIPLEGEKEGGICPFTGGKSRQRVVFARSY